MRAMLTILRSMAWGPRNTAYERVFEPFQNSYLLYTKENTLRQTRSSSNSSIAVGCIRQLW